MKKTVVSLKLAAAAMLIAAAPPANPPVEPRAAAAEVAKAREIAGSDGTQPLFLCRADSLLTVRAAMRTSDQWIPPVQAFDNLYFIGNAFVGVWVIRTSAGLILFDSTETTEQARDHLVPGLTALGLDPRTIRYVIVTHGHWDHFGGAAWLQRTYGAKIGLSEADWRMIETLPKDTPELNHAEQPHRDLVVTDNQVLQLGDTKVRLYVTPGHTPGTVSAIFPARIGSRLIPLSLLGSVAFPASLRPTPHVGGLLAYDRSVQRFERISRDAGAEGILNTHIFADGTRQRLDALHGGAPGAANPFLIGAAATKRYYDVLHHCLRAAEARARQNHGKVEAWR